VKKHEDKFSISNPRNGSYVVVVKDVQLDDSGEYRCIEGVHNPSYGTIMLSVEGNDSTCLPLPSVIEALKFKQGRFCYLSFLLTVV